MALDADTGRSVWEYKFNLFQSDVPPHRIGWASPAADPETGNIYALSGGAQVIALSRDGKLLWDRSFGEEFAAFTTHGGRTMSPLVDGDLVIVSAAVSNWGTHGQPRAPADRARQAHRRRRLRLESGRPALRHGLRVAAHRHHQRHAPADRRPRRRRGARDQAADRRESLELRRRQARDQHRRRRQAATRCSCRTATRTSTGNALGLLAAIDGSQTGDIKTTQWAVQGHRVRVLVAARRRHAPLSDRRRLDAARLRHRERHGALGSCALGTAQKAPPVLADGKIYVGTDNGKFFIIRPRVDRGEILSTVELPISTNSCCGSEGTPEQILGGAAISRGRIFFVSSDAVYAIGSRQRDVADRLRRRRAGGRAARARRRTCRCPRPSWC